MQALKTISSRIDDDKANPAARKNSSASVRDNFNAKANATAVRFETARSSSLIIAEYVFRLIRAAW